MKLAFSWDDGALEDRRLFELHEKYEIPGMFFVPTKNREGRAVITPEIMQKAESTYVRFGGHTANHTYLTSIPVQNVEEEVLSNKKYLEDVLGHAVDDFCLPGGKYTEQILQIVYRHYKTIRTADTMNFTYTGGALKPAIHFYPRGYKSLMGNAQRHKSYKEMLYLATHPYKSYFELVKDIIALESERDNRVVMIWGHSWELEYHQLWDDLEDIMKMIKAQYNGCVSSYRSFFKE